MRIYFLKQRLQITNIFILDQAVTCLLNSPPLFLLKKAVNYFKKSQIPCCILLKRMLFVNYYILKTAYSPSDFIGGKKSQLFCFNFSINQILKKIPPCILLGKKNYQIFIYFFLLFFDWSDIINNTKEANFSSVFYWRMKIKLLHLLFSYKQRVVDIFFTNF